MAGTPASSRSADFSASRELVFGNNVNVNNGAGALLTWDTKGAGVELLDRSTLNAPTIITAGVYAVAVTARGLTMTATGGYLLVLELDANGADATAEDSALASAAYPSPETFAALVYYLPAGALVAVSVLNNDGVAARDFVLTNAVIQRLG